MTAEQMIAVQVAANREAKTPAGRHRLDEVSQPEDWAMEILVREAKANNEADSRS